MTNQCECKTNPEDVVEYRPEDSWTDEHQAIVPGECRRCGASYEYVYNESGIRSAKNFEYVKVF